MKDKKVSSVAEDNLVLTNDDETEMSELFYTQKERNKYDHGKYLKRNQIFKLFSSFLKL